EWHREDRSDVARTQGPIQVWHRTDTIPTDAQGGYAGGDSTAAAIALSQGSVDALAEQVAGINVGVGTLTARDNGDGTGTIVWTEHAGSTGGGGDADRRGATVSWARTTGSPARPPPPPTPPPPPRAPCPPRACPSTGTSSAATGRGPCPATGRPSPGGACGSTPPAWRSTSTTPTSTTPSRASATRRVNRST